MIHVIYYAKSNRDYWKMYKANKINGEEAEVINFNTMVHRILPHKKQQILMYLLIGIFT